jgi:hypothetical protein
MRVLRAAFPLALVLASPAAALAASTGGQAAPAASSTPPQVRPVARPSGPANPAFQLTAPSVSFVGAKLRVAGIVRHGGSRPVRVQYRTLGGTWSQAAVVRATRDGSFAATWIPRSEGAYELRAVARTSRTRTSGLRSVSVFKGQTATWYGPGFYGKATACGVTLTADTLGVAHRSLPCGTSVFVSYGGRGLVVPVIDRGPYSKTAQWDLTGATARAIGMTQTSRIGVLVGTPSW